MISGSNSIKKQKSLEKENKKKINNQKLSPQKNTKLPSKNINSKSVKKYLKPQLSIKNPQLTKDKEKIYNFKEQYSLYKKELQSLRDEEEKIKALKEKLKQQKDIYNNIINNHNNINIKDIKSKTNTKIKRRKNEEEKNFSPDPHEIKKNLINFIEQSNKSSKKQHLISYSNTNLIKNKPVIKHIKEKEKISINLFPQNKYKFDLIPKDIKNKYNSPYKTIHTTRNKSARILFKFDKKEINKENKKKGMPNKIGIISKSGIEINNKTKINQDSYFNYDLKNGYKFIGVCDGHGENGKQVSEFIKNNLPKELENEFNILISSEKKRISIVEGMLKRNEENNSEKKEKFNIEKNIDKEKMEELLKKVYINTNLKLFAENIKLNLTTSGTTCISILYSRKFPKKIYTSNLGDSRAIIINENNENNENNSSWSFVQLSRDHKLSEMDEAERIIKYGGEIQKIQNENGEYEGPLRLFKKNEEGPGLAMSRSFGDSEGQGIGIIAEPEVKEYLIKKVDKALIIATDGLWEYTKNEDVVNIVKNYWDKNDADLIVNELYKKAIDNWKKENCNIDDITIICVILN